MSTPTPAPPASEPTWLRMLRSALAIGLALALTLITALVVLGCLPTVRAAFAPIFVDEGKVPKLAVTLAVLFIVLVPSTVLYLAARKRCLTWPALAVGWLIVLPVLVWLGWDDPAVREPVSIAEFSPVFPGAEKSYAVLMQYSSKTPSEEARAYQHVALKVAGFGVAPQDGDKWVAFVTAHRADLDADWETLAPQRRWVGELEAFALIGDLAESDYESNMPTFGVWRMLTFQTCARATLQAVDGHGDEAFATLLPLLDVSRKLQPASRTLVRAMIAEVVEKMTLQTAAVVLDRTVVSVEARARLAAIIKDENGAALARRMMMCEYVVFTPHYVYLRLGDGYVPNGPFAFLREPLNLLSRLILNPNTTMNLYGAHIRELADLAEHRELGQLVVRTRDFSDHLLFRPGIKNLAGRLIINLSVPAYDKLIEAHWKIVDLRTAMRQRLAAAPGASRPLA